MKFASTFFHSHTPKIIKFYRNKICSFYKGDFERKDTTSLREQIFTSDYFWKYCSGNRTVSTKVAATLKQNGQKLDTQRGTAV